MWSRILRATGMNRDWNIDWHSIFNWRSKLGFGVGICVLVALLTLSPESVSLKLMLPGALICEAFGWGRDDPYGVLTYIFGNALLYGLAFAVLFLFAIRRRRKS